MTSRDRDQIEITVEATEKADSHSLNSLETNLHDANDENDDDTSLNLNDDLASFSGRSNSMLSGGGDSRKSFDSSSIFTPSFRASFDDSLPSLGLNKLSIQTVSPLGPNSIYELIADVDARRSKHSSTLNPHVNSRSHKRSLNIPPPTQKDIPLIHLTKLEKVPKEELQAYMKDIGKEYEKHTSSKMVNLSNLKKLSKQKQGNEGVGAIPEIFFNNDFNLDDPRIFKVVTENSELTDINESLQEKLSNYLDIIEVDLVDEISNSSGSFFDALNELGDINKKNIEALKLIGILRDKIEHLRKNKIESSQKRINLQNKRDNVSRLEQALLQIKTIMVEYEVALSLFLQGEYDICLRKVDDIENLINGEDQSNEYNWPYKLQNLKNLVTLDPIRGKLASLRSSTGQSISKIFVSFLLADLRQHHEDISFKKTFERLVSNDNYKRSVQPDFKTQLNGYIQSLVKSGELSSAFRSYGDQAVNDMKNIVRTFLPGEEETETTAPFARDSSPSTTTTTTNMNTSRAASGKNLTALIRAMTPREFEDMLIKIFTSVSEGLRRLTVHQKLLLDLTLNNTEIDPTIIPNLDIRESIHSSIQLVQLRTSKIIHVRNEINASLRIDFFLRFFYILSVFLTECENISGLNFQKLPAELNEQIRNFNNTLHNSNLKKIAKAIEGEEWKPLIVSHQLQETVDNIVKNKNLDFGNEWKNDLLHLRDEPSENSKYPEKENSHKRSIVVGDKTFVASDSLLTLVTITRDLLILKSNFLQLATHYEANIIELYKNYNGRTMQNIKKSDNSLNKDKNLSVVGESLDCITELIHYIRVDFNYLDHDDAYNNLLAIIKSSKSKIDSINTIPE